MRVCSLLPPPCLRFQTPSLTLFLHSLFAVFFPQSLLGDGPLRLLLLPSLHLEALDLLSALILA